MGFTRPTLTQLIAQARSDLETHLVGADAHLRYSVENVIARVIAGAAHGLHGHMVWLSKQLIPDTAQDEWLTRWASIWLDGEVPIQATKATGPITITTTGNATVPVATVYQTADGTQYTVDVAVSRMGAGTMTASVTAVVAGADGQQLAGAVVTLVTPIALVVADAVVATGGLTGGADTELPADLLDRLLLRLQSPPKGGGPTDYVQWALQVAGVTRAWEFACIDGPGEVAVYFARDADTPIIPDAAEVAAVQTYIDTKAPITADVTVYAPTGVAFNVTITSLIPNTAAVIAAVVLELNDLLLRVSEPGCTLYISQINEAISIATGETNHVLTVPAADIVYAFDEMPIKGTYTINGAPY